MTLSDVTARRLVRRRAALLAHRVAVWCLIAALAVPLWVASFRNVPTASAQDDETIGLYEKFELTLDWGVTYNNPFDPDEVRLDATFTAPNGDQWVVPGFYYQEFRQYVPERGYEELEPVSDPVWKVRFTPVVLGTHRYEVTVVDARGEQQVASGTFEVVPSSAEGFVRVGPLGERTFELTTGEPFIMIGLNAYSTWTSNSDPGLTSYRERMPLLGEIGINTFRTQLTPNDYALIWSPNVYDYGVWRHYGGLGHYNLASAWKLDEIMDMAEAAGMRVFFNIDQALALSFYETTGAVGWENNPYNVANGGMLNKPAEYFSNEEAKRHFKNQLRYLVARWGYSTTLLMWELFNEFDWVVYEQKFTEEEQNAVLDWHVEMADYLDHIDPFEHPITTNTATPARFWPDDSWYYDLWQIPDIDVCNIHLYDDPLLAGTTVENIVEYLDLYYARTAKPCVISEWGLDAAGHADREDEVGAGLHDALGAGTMYKAAIMPHYTNLVHDFDLYYHIEALVAYLEGEREGLGGYDFADLAISDVQLEVLGLSRPDRTLAWIHNKQSFANSNQEPAQVRDATLTIRGLVPGQYWIEFWDTYHGQVVDVQTTIHDREPMVLSLPPVDRDLAIKVRLRP